MSAPRSRARIETDAGTEIQCAKCKDFWPEDKEFFYYTPKGGYHSWCKACYQSDPMVGAKVQRGKDKAKALRAANKMDACHAHA